jgi:hypothetical protein
MMNRNIVACTILSFISLFVTVKVNAQLISKDTQFETRCGWYSNPTPSNHSFYDKEGEWLVGVQGGYQAKSVDMPFKKRQWVMVTGGYGYGCACLRLKVDKQTSYVLEVKSSYAKPLAACRTDKALRRWKSLFE